MTFVLAPVVAKMGASITRHVAASAMSCSSLR